MTNKELDNAFKLYLDKVDSQATPDFLVGERQRILNDSLLWVASQITSKKDNNQDEVDLRRSLSKTLIVTLTSNSFGAGVATLPTDYLHYGRITIQLKKPLANYQIPPRIVAESELDKALNDPFNGPAIGTPIICFTENQLLVYPGASCDKVLGAYYRYPVTIDLSKPSTAVDLVEALIPTLLQRAVQLALESISDPRFQTQAQVATLTQTPTLSPKSA